jgi:C-5 cytosine-specific DNA methylase
MSAEENGISKDEGLKNCSTLLADSQAGNWDFGQIPEGDHISETPQFTDQQENSKKRKFDHDVKLPGCSIASSVPRQAQRTKMRDAGTIKSPDDMNASSSIEKSNSSSSTEKLPRQYKTFVYVDDDGEYVEMKAPVDGPAGFRHLPTNQNLTLRNTRGNHQGRLDSWLSSASAMSSTSSSDKAGLQSFDPSVARNFSTNKSSNIDLGNCMTDEELEQRIKAGSFNSPQAISEGDKVLEYEEIENDKIVYTEEDIENHLQSLVISRPTESLPNLGQQIGQPEHSEIDAVNLEDLRRGVTVELHDGSFLRIESVRKDCWRVAVIKGYELERNARCGRKFPDLGVNELVWITEINGQEHQAGLDAVLQEVRLSEVKRLRTVIFTNQPYSQLSFKNELEQSNQKLEDINRPEVEESGRLYCRWKYIQVHNRLKTDAEASISLLSYDEAAGVGCLEPSDVRKNWRGDSRSVPGGDSIKPQIDPETNEETTLQRYTLGDCFCGAGGVSRGAIQAGLDVAWAFDNDMLAIHAHRKNFRNHGTESLLTSDAQFMDKIKQNGYYADVVHYSPPCQGFSEANHNHNWKLDFKNRKALFSVRDLTERLRPRIATVEETTGLPKLHPEWFDSLINNFLSVGYSVRWKMVRCQGFGIPQSRVRLVLVAAAYVFVSSLHSFNC